MTEKRAAEVSADLTARIKYCRRLPTLPAVALQLVDLANDPSATLSRFGKVIERDPALVSNLLRVANSPFYGHGRAVTNLSQALSLLGLDTTISLALNFALRGPRSRQRDFDFQIGSYWRRSLLTALASRAIATELHETQPEDFFVAGLLQDIGVLVMDALLGDTYAILHAKSSSHEDLLKRETIAFDFNHAEAGARVLRDWQLPEAICSSVLLSHATTTFSPERIDEFGRLPVCVAVAMGIADAWIEGGSAEALEAAREPAHKWLHIGPEPYQRITAAVERQIAELESLFEADVADPHSIQCAEDSAAEILVARNLQSMRSAVSAGMRAQALEHRTMSLEKQARRDAMTGLFNRAYLERELEHQFKRATRERRPFSLAFVDVDRFKVINDTLGHRAGDQVLIAVARCLLCQIRQADIVARYGGEEFVVLLTDTCTADAKAVMERMLSSVRETPFYAPGGQAVTLTVSVGVATHVEDGHAFETAEALLKAADSALYGAKKAGRGRVMVHRAGHEVV